MLLDLQQPADAARFETLRSEECIEVLDHLEDQRRALGRLVPKVAPTLVDEAPRWVYYPWRRALVHVLGPQGFALLRLDRNRNKITRPEQAALARQRIGVVGLSVGHAIAFTLALEGLCGELRLADFDEIELSNLNRIPATVLDLGVNKAVLAARRIAELDPYLPVKVWPEGLDEASMESFIGGLDVVVEECDSLDIKLLVREVARRHRVPVVMDTSDRGLLDVERFDLEPERLLFHGLLGDLRAADLKGLSTHDKVPFVLRILEPELLSARMAASMAEIDYTVTTWPQLGGDIMLGAASVASAVRRIGRGDPLASGRVRLDLAEGLDAISSPEPVVAPEIPAAIARSSTIELDAPRLSVLAAARLAPSGGNSQPWAFELGEGEMSIDLVPERSSAMDVALRGSYVAAGAALFNARVAASAGGILGSYDLLPDPARPLRAATLHFGEGHDEALSAQYEAMLARCTNRRAPSGVQRLDEGTIAALHAAVGEEGGRLRLCTEPEAIRHGAALLGESDRLRFLAPTLHREMMGELSWPGVDALDLGLDVRTLELDGSDMAKLAVAKRGDVMAQLAAWGGGGALGEVTRERVGSSAALAVVTVPGASPRDYLQGGAAVERLWITASKLGLATQPVSPVFLFAVEPADQVGLVGEDAAPALAALSEDFRQLFKIPSEEQLILLLRLSHAPEPTARSQRLSISELVKLPHG